MLGGARTRLSLRPALAGEAQRFMAALLAGMGWVFSVNKIREMPPLFFIGSRFLLAGSIVGLIAFQRARRLRFFDVAHLTTGALFLGFAMIGWIIGLGHTSNPGVAAFISATGNLLVPVLGKLMFRCVQVVRSFSHLSWHRYVAGAMLIFRNSLPTTHRREHATDASSKQGMARRANLRRGSGDCDPIAMPSRPTCTLIENDQDSSDRPREGKLWKWDRTGREGASQCMMWQGWLVSEPPVSTVF
jgi:hypothetical protein